MAAGSSDIRHAEFRQPAGNPLADLPPHLAEAGPTQVKPGQRLPQESGACPFVHPG